MFFAQLVPYLTLLGDIADKRFPYCDRCYRSVVRLSVCLSRSCIVLKRQNTFFAYDSAMSLPERVKIWLTLISPSFLKFALKRLTPCWFERRRHWMANSGRSVRDSAIVTVESLLETIIALSNGIVADSIRPPLPQNTDHAMSPFAKLLWPLLFWCQSNVVWWSQ